MRLGQLARRGYQLKAVSGRAGTFGGVFGSAAGRNWNLEAGLKYDNSIVFAAIRFAVAALTEVDIYVRRPDGRGNYREVPGHPITELLKNPNPWYDGQALISGWIISELTASAGCSYTFKHRSPAGKLIALEYVPHFAISFFSSLQSGNFIDKYIVSMAGGPTDVSPGNILQQRFGPIDPLRPQISYGPLNAALLDVVTDKQAANYTAAILANVGVTPHLISPAVQQMDGRQVIFGKEQADQIKALWSEIRGDNRGNPLVAPLSLKVDNLSFSPEDLNLEGIRNISEERVCAVLGIPPQVLNLGTGLEQTNNRASAEAAARQAARTFTKPYMRRKARELSRDLVPELGQPGDEVVFRVEEIEALQEDKTEAAKRDELEVTTWKTINEKRAEKGLPPIDGGDRILEKNSAARSGAGNSSTQTEGA